ncbi:MAG: hypothetical protein KVP17_004804 [Porospora cf. gigantea B]|uniref:uncharacterized protein n=1 Tax=Porospora cf. gigantea B TaxID=2853592 RepID=UPI003571EE51|nr:MAG: hypothetical protein KVP17_004804 [Porospora cf. gigantea B]
MSANRIVDFLGIALQQALYIFKCYPDSTFEPSSFYDIPTWKVTSQPVVDYLSEILASLTPLIQTKMLQSVYLEIYDAEEPVKRLGFELNCSEESDASDSNDMEADCKEAVLRILLSDVDDMPSNPNWRIFVVPVSKVLDMLENTDHKHHQQANRLLFHWLPTKPNSCVTDFSRVNFAGWKKSGLKSVMKGTTPLVSVFSCDPVSGVPGNSFVKNLTEDFETEVSTWEDEPRLIETHTNESAINHKKLFEGVGYRKFELRSTRS